MPTVYKILNREEWADAVRAGAFHGSAIDLKDGYIHLSAAHQLRETAAKHFAGLTDLVLVALEAEALGDALRWEVSRGGDRFPHVYGVLDPARVDWVQPLPMGADGRHVFPKEVA